MTFTIATAEKWFHRRVAKLIGISAVVCISAGMGVVGCAKQTIAAEKLVFTFGAIGDSVEIEELQTFVETGEIPRTLRPYLKLTDTDPDAVRAILKKEARVSLRFVDKVLNTLPGEYGLFQLGTLIHTPTRTANIQALRAALVLSASDDNQISLLEFLQKYPTPEVVIDGVAVLKLARTFGRVKEQVADKVAEIERRLDAWLAVAQDLLQNLVCECESDTTTPGNTISPGSSTPPNRSPVPRTTPIPGTPPGNSRGGAER